MIRHSFLFIFVATAVALGACGGEEVGRICDLGVEAPGVNETVVASPSLDCTTRTCLKVPLTNALPAGSRYPDGNRGLCTAECESDDDCERVPESPCAGGFTCAIPTTVGPFCCRKFCICKDYVVIPENGTIPEPLACDAGNPDNACCNLPGRAGQGICP
ncbi:MAG: hypothetical protein KBG28_04680 [Kofleriaceae bacterium]|jgi:hypothetical protein|nr:hypothetical protein [Kofleriaceae bacterium]MBP9203237.1 hypothetical protein [Kofleriaceae bacterium]